jgi:hypothetical protein
MIAGAELLQQLRLAQPKTGLLIDSLIDGINSMAAHLGVDPTGKVAPPDPISSIAVAAGPDLMHVTLTDNSQVKKGTNYFVEHSVDNGATWHVTHLNASRGVVLALPTKNAAGTKYNYLVRGYSQLPGSDAQPSKITHGGTYTPTNVQLTGTAAMDLLPSTGSGTASVNGQQGGQGLGTDLTRPAIGPKRPNLNNPVPHGSAS